MPYRGCPALHGVNLNLKNDKLVHCNSQFMKCFGSLQMSFCIFSKNYELLKSDFS